MSLCVYCMIISLWRSHPPFLHTVDWSSWWMDYYRVWFHPALVAMYMPLGPRSRLGRWEHLRTIFRIIFSSMYFTECCRSLHKHVIYSCPPSRSAWCYSRSFWRGFWRWFRWKPTPLHWLALDANTTQSSTNDLIHSTSLTSHEEMTNLTLVRCELSSMYTIQNRNEQIKSKIKSKQCRTSRFPRFTVHQLFHLSFAYCLLIRA